MQVTYKLEQHLKTICGENKEYDDLLATWNINKRSYCEALKPITQNYPHYTEHGVSHSETILANIELLLGEEQIRKLSPTDTWLILQAAYLHDIGMSLLYKDIENVWETETFQRYLSELKDSCDKTLREAAGYILDMKEHVSKKDFPLNWPIQVRRYVTVIISDYYRKKHGEMSKEYIEEMNNLWGIDLDFNGLIQERLIKLLGQISYLHTQNSEDVMKLEYKSIGHNADYIHPRFVAAIIRMGDLLDVDNNRFNSYIYKTIGALPDASQKHIGKHKSTRHILITPNEIEYKADCATQEIYRETRVFLSWLIKETDFLAKEWKSIVPENFVSSAPKLGKTEILLDGKPDLNGVADLRFNISQEKAFQIIEGTNLYNNKYIYMRELVQNALDACKLQMWRDLRNGKYSAWMNTEINENLSPFDVDPNIYRNYEVKISTNKIDNSTVEITVSDNGTGISVESLKQMCDVGTSYWGKKEIIKEIGSMPSWLRPTAGFGIGLQSVFLVTDYFEIISTCDGNEIKAVVESRKKNGFVQIAASNTGWKRGTQIILRVPEEKVKDTYVFDYDPFEADNRLLELTIKKELLGTCSTTYFPIVLYMDDKEISRIDNFSFKELDCTWQDEGGYKFKLEDDLTSMRIWDKHNSIFYKMDLCVVDDKYWSRRDDFQLFFKGMELYNDCEESFIYVKCKMDIYGMETRSSLSLNRRSLLRETQKTVDMLIKDIKEFYFDMIKQNFNSTDEITFSEKWGGQSKAEKLFSYFSLLSFDDKVELLTKHPERFNIIEKIIDVFQINYDEKEIEKKQIKVTELVKNIDLVACIDHMYIGRYSGSVDILSLLQRKLKEEVITSDCKYIMPFYPTTYGFYEYGFGKVTVLDKGIILYHLCERVQQKVYLDEKDEDVFYSMLLFLLPDECAEHVGKRNAIPTLHEFLDLAVEDVPRGVCRLGDIRIYDIISPLLKSDVELIGKYEKETYCDMILQREDTKLLIEYVFKNQVRDKKNSLEYLRGQYKELIQKTYQWYQDKNNDMGVE